MLENIQSFSDEGLIKKTTAENLISWIKQENTPHWVTDSINQLIEEKHWDEINNRFFKNISFGTGEYEEEQSLKQSLTLKQEIKKRPNSKLCHCRNKFS